jgi:hypothetical protein
MNAGFLLSRPAAPSISLARGFLYSNRSKVVLSFLLWMGLRLPLEAAPPANDAFANATALGATVPVNTSGTNVDATLETGEPLPVSTAVASVWWKWTAPATASFQVDTDTSSPDTALGVYTGTAVAALTTIASNDNISTSDTDSRVIFNGTSGTTYAIQIMSARVGRGVCRLNIKQRPPEGSDAFASATDLGQPATANGGGYINAATMESGEPKIPTGFWNRSLWWKWKAPATGVVEINTVGSGYNTALAIYTGTSVTALTRVAWNNDITTAPTSFQSRVRFPATAGVIYLIQVAGGSSTTGDTLLEIKPGPVPPANDSFAGATNMGAIGSTTVTGTNVNATLEVGEPTPVSDQITTQSVWWRWTAPATGQVEVNTTGSAFNTILAVFTGDSVSALNLEAFNDDAPGATAGESESNFPAVAGQTYYIQVSARTGPNPEGAVTLTLASGLAGAVNDHFAAAANLGSAATTTVTGTNIGATVEPGEPAPGGTGSVWWRWTAPATGPVEINTLGSDINSRLTIYTGNTLGSLVMMVTNDTAVGVLDGSGSPPSEQSLVRIHAIAGTVYFIQVLGVDIGEEDEEDRGDITLTVKPGPAAPANDNFATAANLGSAATVSNTVDGTYATIEAGEPVPVIPGVVLVPDWHLHATLWWKWTAPATGWILIKPGANPAPHAPPTLLGVFTGNTLATLQQTPSNRLRATAGTIYMIQASYHDGPSFSGPMTVEIIPLPDPPPNDNLANAINLGSAASLSVTGTTLNASTEPGEPNPHYISELPLGPTSWWKWTPPATGRVQVTITGADVAAYTGTPAFDSFTGKRNIQNTPTFQWQVIAGVTYYLQANSVSEDPSVSFQVVPSATPSDGYAGWIAAIPGFTTAQHHPEADPDRDGVPNGLEYVLGRTPHQWQPWPFTAEIVTQGANRYAALHFTLPAGYTTLVNALLKVQESTNLQTWQTTGEQISNGNWIGNTERWTEGGVTHIRIRTTNPVQASQPRGWLRLATPVTW